MPAESALTDLGREFRSWLPVALQRSPDHVAVLHAYAKELGRLEARLEQTRAQFFPQTADLLLAVYERLLKLPTVEGATVEERRLRILAQFRALRSTTWQAQLSAMIGSEWTYEEHIPGDPASPPVYTIRVELPFPPDGARYQQVERFNQEFAPSHLDFVFTFAGGFVLDRSQLDQEQMR